MLCRLPSIIKTGLVVASLSACSLAFATAHYPGLSNNAYKTAVAAYQCAMKKGLVKNPVLSIVDFTLPSKTKRLWVINMKQHKLMYHLLVAQGKGSGLFYAKHFSNKLGSDTSSLGAYLTLDSYYGKHGYSLRLRGLEKGLNNNAFERDIVMHSAWYVSEKFAHRYDRLGRSWGCFALSQKEIKPVVSSIKDGSIIFAYAKQELHDPNVSKCKF